MTIWYQDGEWHDDEILPSKKILIERMIISYRPLEIPYMNKDNYEIYELRLDCGHSIAESVKNKSIPKGLYRLCEKCRGL